MPSPPPHHIRTSPAAAAIILSLLLRTYSSLQFFYPRTTRIVCNTHVKHRANHRFYWDPHLNGPWKPRKKMLEINSHKADRNDAVVEKIPFHTIFLHFFFLSRKFYFTTENVMITRGQGRYCDKMRRRWFPSMNNTITALCIIRYKYKIKITFNYIRIN